MTWYLNDRVVFPVAHDKDTNFLEARLAEHCLVNKKPHFHDYSHGSPSGENSLKECVQFIKKQDYILYKKSRCDEYYINDNGLVHVSCNKKDGQLDSFTVWISSLKLKEVLDITEFCNNRILKQTPIGKVKILISTQTGLHIETLGTIKCPFIRENYTEATQKSFDKIVKEFKQETPAGRLAILHGPPGTGKSFFIRSLISSIENTFIYIPAGTVGQLSGPEVIGTILEYEEDKKQPITLILEDADNALMERDRGNANQLAEILNISDGLLGELVNIRIVATTNQDKLKIDKAALRPGRLCASVQFDPLLPDHAASVYKKLTNKDIVFNKEISLAEIYSQAKNPEFEKHKEKKDQAFGDYV